MSDDDVLQIADVAKLLKVKVSTVYALVARRAIPVKHVGRLLRFSRTRLEAWLLEDEVPATKRRGFLVPVPKSGELPGRRIG